MSQIEISSTAWLAISLRNGVTGVFNLCNTCAWQYFPAEPVVNQSEADLHRNLIKFSPNGQFFIFNGGNKRLNVYRQSDYEKSKVWWELQRTMVMKNSTSAIDLSDECLHIADIVGDIHKVDLFSNDEDPVMIITKNKSMVLDLIFMPINPNSSCLITASRDEIIHLNYYPNTSIPEGHCIGHTEFVSHVKLIDPRRILSASGDGTVRLWRLPNCVPLVLLHSKAFTLLSTEVFYSDLDTPENSFLFENNSIPMMSAVNRSSNSSILDYSIWKMDATTYNSHTFLAFSTYLHRSQSIYLTTLSNMKRLKNEQRKLTLDTGYGTIVDYCFPAKNDSGNANLYLYVLFNTNVLVKVDVISILLYNRTNFFAQPNETIQEINEILTRREFHLDDQRENSVKLDEILFGKLDRNPVNSSNSSSHKRKIERIDDEQRQKKSA